MRIIKWLFGGLFIVFLLLAVVATYLAVTFDPNEHKQTVVDLVKERTGRDIEIEGDLEMSFYPWLSLSMGEMRLSNAEGFTAESFARFDAASASLQLMPLLQKRIVADRIELSGAEIWLARNQYGRTNWDDVLQKLNGDQSSAEPLPQAGETTAYTGRIAGLSIKDAKVHWNDKSTDTMISLSNLNLETGQLAIDEETSVDTDFQFELRNPVIQGQVKLVGRTRLSSQAPYLLASPNIELNLQGIDLQAQNVQANIVADELSYADGKININQPNVVYDITNMPSLGEQAKGTLKSTTLDLVEGQVSLDTAIVDIAILSSAFPGETMDASLNAEKLTLSSQALGMSEAKLESTFTGDPWPQGQQAVAAAFDQFDYAIDKAQLTIPAFSAEAFGLDVSGSAVASDVTSELKLSGKLQVQEFSPKEVAKRLAIELPEMSDEAWQQATVKGNYSATKNSVRLSELTANIDSVDWTGAAAIDDLNEKKLSFDLSAKSLDLNRLIPPEQADALKDNASDKGDAAVNNIVIPIEPLRIWDVDGVVSLGKFTFGNMVSTNLNAKLDLLDGLLKVSPTQMQVFGGTETGNWTLDARSEIPRLTGQERFESIELAQIGNAMWQKQYMTGTITGQISVDTQGKTIGDMRENLNGNLDVKVDEGVMQGIDVNYALANAVSLFRDKTLTREIDTKQTPFKQLSATGRIENGILRNEDFLAIMPRMRARGQGSFSFVDTSVNYALDADVLESKAADLDPSIEVNLDELVGATIPIKISGDLSEPNIRPDVGGFLKTKLEQELKNKARAEIEDKLKDKIGGELGGVLGDILGGGNKDPETEPDAAADKSAPAQEEVPEQVPEEQPAEKEPLTPEEELKKKEEELKNKAKDKLKDLFGG